MGKRLQIKPVYGFGWYENGKWIEVPEPFVVDVATVEGGNEEEPKRLMGVVVESHRFTGKTARLERRTSGPVPSYNVLIYETLAPPNVQVAPTATGFAELLPL